MTVSTPIGETRFCYRNFKFPELLRNHFADLIGRGGSDSFAPLSGPFYSVENRAQLGRFLWTW